MARKTVPKGKIAKKRIYRYGITKFINPIHNFKYKVLTKNFMTVKMNGTDQFFTYNFTLNNIGNYVELVKLFDQFKICKVKLTLIPRYNSNLILPSPVTGTGPAVGATNTLVTANLGMPDIITVIDYDDSVVPTSMLELLEYNNCKITKASRNHVRSLVPRINSSTGISFKKQWLDCDTADAAPHYGVKIGCVNIPLYDLGEETYPAFFVDCIAEYHLSMKTTR